MRKMVAEKQESNTTKTHAIENTRISFSLDLGVTLEAKALLPMFPFSLPGIPGEASQRG